MCPSVGTTLASTASPSFVQRSSRESSASLLTCSRKRSSFGFVRFDIGVDEGTAAACLRECQKLGKGSIQCVRYFHRISRSPSQTDTNLQCGGTNECVMACTVRATRFSTPTLRINLATCALTVRLLMPNGTPISLLDRPSTSIFKTCVSRSVKATWSVGEIRRGELLMRSMKIESILRGTQTEPRLTIRIACTKSAGDAAAST